jgi:hypothetical protein
VHPTTPQQQREETLKREEAKREEKERLALEEQLREFDAYGFYEKLTSWTGEQLPKPQPQAVNVTPLRQTTVMQQPLPISRQDLQEIRKISSHSARLLALLRAIDQKGIECPYVHQQYRATIEKALEKCEQIKAAGDRYFQSKGFWARLGQFLNKFHVSSTKRDVDFFKNRLEAILMMCKHQELAQDLVKLRQSFSRPEVQPQQPKNNPPPRVRPLFPGKPPQQKSPGGGK